LKIKPVVEWKSGRFFYKMIDKTIVLQRYDVSQENAKNEIFTKKLINIPILLIRRTEKICLSFLMLITCTSFLKIY